MVRNRINSFEKLMLSSAIIGISDILCNLAHSVYFAETISKGPEASSMPYGLPVALVGVMGLHLSEYTRRKF